MQYEPITFTTRKNTFTILPTGDMLVNGVPAEKIKKSSYWYFKGFPITYFKREFNFNRTPTIHAIIFFLFGDRIIGESIGTLTSETLTIDHIDKDRTNNDISNLTLKTHRENSGDRNTRRVRGKRNIYVYGGSSNKCISFNSARQAIFYIGWYVKNILYNQTCQYPFMFISFNAPTSENEIITLPKITEIRKKAWRSPEGLDRKDIIKSILA